VVEYARTFTMKKIGIILDVLLLIAGSCGQTAELIRYIYAFKTSKNDFIELVI